MIIDEPVRLCGVLTNNEIIKHVVEEINHARNIICFMMFKLDSEEAVCALVRAADRGVKVYMLLDDRSTQYNLRMGGG